MTVRLTAAQVRRLGIETPPTTSRSTRKVVPAGPYRSRCHTCGETFSTFAAEDRHVSLTHSRFELVL